MKKEDIKIIGEKFNQKEYEKAILERWQKISLESEIYHCLFHNTFFTPYVVEDEAEPCWKCYEEFREII